MTFPAENDTSPAFDSGRIVRSQDYFLKRQQEMLEACIERNSRLVATLNSLELENEKLRKELSGYRNGKLWTVIVSLLPTREMLRD